MAYHRLAFLALALASASRFGPMVERLELAAPRHVASYCNAVNYGDPRQTIGAQRDFFTIARAAGTDKVTAHQYQHVYQRFLGPLSLDNTTDFLMIEIGFAGGASAQAFRTFLPRADLHEIEIGCVKPRTPVFNDWIYDAPLFRKMRSEGRLHCGNGADETFMLPLLQTLGRAPRIVVDDGGHSAEEMIGSFTLLFPRLAACGLFFMEDLAESYRVGETGFHNVILRPLLDAVHYDANDWAVDHLQRLPELAHWLRAIHCAKHICVFERNDRAPLGFD
jgi:hypothetical protein